MILAQFPGKTSASTSPPPTPPSSPPAMTASASPTTIGASGTTATLDSNSTTATPTNGTAAYTYSWAVTTEDGLAGYVIAAPTSATTYVTASGLLPGASSNCSIQCTVTDSLAATALTGTVSCSFYREGGGGLPGGGGGGGETP